ncbi:MFS transporter [Streptomyces sp. TS71-3]|uniref:MFS transporter n=1 Tax=Streptomyces sp. TS71-3 TaxID=2733862 RepID=UPI001B256439|nr:MFS transporter [Streptomyces sp. TS71-3]GHJ37049.1 hypothetical protein Sm713_26580 [Streptomyces sp. TS71-3]
MTRIDDEVSPARSPESGEATEPSPFRDRRFVTFAVGNVANNLGEALYAVALPLLVYHVTGSLGSMTLLAAAVPAAMLLSPTLGSIADRRGVRGLVRYGLLVQAAAATAMNLLLLRHDPPVWLLFVCALLVAAGGVAYRTGWITGVPATFPSCPTRARGTLNSSFLATTMVGPVLVSALLPAFGYTGLLWLNLPTFFAPLVVMAMGIGPPPVPKEQADEKDRREWRPAVRAVFKDHRMLALLIVQLVLDIACGNGLTTLVLYDLAHSWRLSGEQASLAIAAMNLSSLVGNLFVSQRRRFPAWLWLTSGMALRAVSLVLLATPMWPVFLTVLVVGQFGQGMVLATVVMGRVKYLPKAVLGRASGVLWLLTGGAGLVSSTAVVVVNGALGTPATFVVLGLAASTVLWYLARSRSAWTGPNPAKPQQA